MESRETLEATRRLEAAEADLDLAEIELWRSRSLVSSEVAAQERVDRATNALAASTAAVRTVELMAGKSAPYIVIGMIQTTLVLLFAAVMLSLSLARFRKRLD